MYCNTDVVIMKPVTGRARICSASLKTTRRLTALGFHKEKEVCQHSHSSDPVPVHTIHAIYCSTQYIGMSKCIELYCTVVLQYCYILIYCDSSSDKYSVVVTKACHSDQLVEYFNHLHFLVCSETEIWQSTANMLNTFMIIKQTTIRICKPLLVLALQYTHNTQHINYTEIGYPQKVFLLFILLPASYSHIPIPSHPHSLTLSHPHIISTLEEQVQMPVQQSLVGVIIVTEVLQKFMSQMHDLPHPVVITLREGKG